MGGLRDPDIRRALRRTIFAHYQNDPDTVVVEELGILCGAVRVDLAVVNGRLHGYEIKSEADTLERLPRQAHLYSQVFDKVTVVVPERQVQRVTGIVPTWWEIVVPTKGKDRAVVRFRCVRHGKRNPHVNPRALAELLWRDEVLALLAERHADTGVRSKPRTVLWDRLCRVYSLDEIRQFVRDRLRERAMHQPDLPLATDGARTRSDATL